MSKNSGTDYKKSGVNIDEGNRFVSLIKNSVKSTENAGVMGGIGGFAGFFDLSAFSSLKEPVLVSGTDGVGTKLKVAIMAESYCSVGIDLVAMSVNDVAVTGAKPLFFLDYLATGKLIPEKMSKVVEGIASGCREAGCALLGGETAEMPGMYAGDDFDLAGFAVGIVDKSKIIDGSNIKEGCALVGVGSSGFHSNGYSLLRNVLFNELKMKPTDIFVDNLTVAQALLIPTKIYVPLAQAVMEKINVLGMVHITGGGFYENIIRILPQGIGANIDVSSVEMPAVIEKFAAVSGVAKRELYRVLNMGVGYVFVVEKQDVDTVINVAKSMGEKAWLIGETVKGSEIKIKGIDFE
ncbi:MAG: phosphoribosylformylglycinamidine cyclo-ligase [Deferribacterales bacterium]|nr:phosphoribosylformylglycinamidine cyclo-ligase [Deferribacterales bacterium]